jgi:hypothetical protein
MIDAVKSLPPLPRVVIAPESYALPKNPVTIGIMSLGMD